ncbi:Zn(2)-C6 fungal-type domain-containing protein [Mycena kentingensis (nom. inval.)]|nr:Zn(2)-C6 fungal-type domain-containing protein [Mycena kentingensis (nom. inval.)]
MAVCPVEYSSVLSYAPPPRHGQDSHVIFGTGPQSTAAVVVGANSAHSYDAFAAYSSESSDDFATSNHFPLDTNGPHAHRIHTHPLPLPKLQIPSPSAIVPSRASAPPLSAASLSRVGAHTFLPPSAPLFPLTLGKFHPPPSLSRYRHSAGASVPLNPFSNSGASYRQISEAGQGDMQQQPEASGSRPRQKRGAEDVISPTSEGDLELDAEGEIESETEQLPQQPERKRRRGNSGSPPLSAVSLMSASSMSPTTATKSRPTRRSNSSTVIACRQCRTRKIRCGSERPRCSNCTRRGEADTCEYDSQPRRRGPDKQPGTRQRRCKKRIEEDREKEKLEAEYERQRRANIDSESLVTAGEGQRAIRPLPRISTNLRAQQPGPASASVYTPSLALVDGGTTNASQTVGIEAHPMFPPIPPAFISTQQGWWDAFLRSYSIRVIATNLDALYTEPGPSLPLSFVNPRFLLETLWNPTRRLTLQPAFILASMAMAVLLRSHDGPGGAGLSGRDEAAFLRQSAQDALERAWQPGGWRDASLAEAALLIAQYEASAHPEYQPGRVVRALGLLDRVLQELGLTTLDSGRPDVCRFAHEMPPSGLSSTACQLDSSLKLWFIGTLSNSISSDWRRFSL